MTEKELRKMNRYQLLELLMLQAERADQLEKQLRETQEQLHARNTGLSQLGSIAEASLKINGVMESAQKAADMYLEAARAEAAAIVENARQQALAIAAHSTGEASPASTAEKSEQNA